jgi:uncharacterized protein (TIGR00255 family)
MPLSGMTGFAREEGASGAWRWTVEARSVNGRGLEVRLRAPQGFDSLDRAAREAAQARFQRGQLNLTLQAKREGPAAGPQVDQVQLERYLVLCEPFVSSGRAVPPAMDGLLALPGVIAAAGAATDEDLEAAELEMVASVGRALDALKAARGEEGAALAPILGGLVDQIEALTAQAAAEAKDQPAIIKERFAKRIADLVDHGGELEARIVQEAAVMAGRADVREELDRLAGHVAAARALLMGDGPAGRRLDFLTQEFMREANTLCSKAALPGLTTIGLELKAVIDQLREQVQNVE